MMFMSYNYLKFDLNLFSTTYNLGLKNQILKFYESNIAIFKNLGLKKFYCQSFIFLKKYFLNIKK